MSASKTDDGAELHETTLSRRRFMATTAAVGAAAVAGGAGVAAAEGGLTLDEGSEKVNDPYITGTETIAEHQGDMSQLEYVADDGEVASLKDDGIVMARRPETDSDVPVAHNPVTFSAANIESEEYTAFPRGATYDDDADADTDEVDVSALEATHWTTANASSGSISVTESDGALSVSASAMAGGETVTARFDLSSVASEDVSITDGVPRKWLQVVMDVDALPAGSSVVFGIEDSTGTKATAAVDPSGDESNVDDLATATGTSLVREARVGELEDAQSVDLEDITVLEIAIKEADAGITLHGLNLERESRWTFGTVESVNSDDELEENDVEEPSGSVSITSLKSLDGTPFASATIRDLKLDVEQRASELPSGQTLARTEPADAYDRDKILEVVRVFEWPTAYDLSSALDKVLDEVALPASRHLTVEIASGTGEVEDWDDVDAVSSWTSKTSSYDAAIETDVELSTTPTVGDRVVVRYELLVDDNELEAMTTSASALAAGAVGGGGGWFGSIRSVIMAVVVGVAGYIGWTKDVLGIRG